MTDAARSQIRAATLIWMASVAASRVAGLVREMVIARAAGATGHTDVYFTAFTLPDFINYLLAGGALSITFIPIFTALLVKGKDEEGWRVFSTAMTFLGIILVVLLALGWIFARPLCAFLAGGFGPEKQALLVRYTRILLPAQLFFFAGGLFGAVQMARGRHAIYALSPLVYNGGIIAGGLLMDPRQGMEGFCWGALVGAMLGHGALQALGASRVGMRLSFRLEIRHPAIREYLLLTLPFMIGQSILVTDDWLVRYFGSHLPEASISWLNYAKKLAQVLPAVLGQASAVAAFPTLARQAASGALGEMAATLRHGLSRALLLSAVGAVLLGVLGREAVLLAFGSGRFTPSDAQTTGWALAIYAVGVPAWVIQAILARGYYALRDTWTPTLLGTAITLAGIPLYGFLAGRMQAHGGGYLGLALASTISFVVYAVLLHAVLAVRLRRREPAAPPLLGSSLLLKGGGLILTTLAAAALLRGAVAAIWPEPTAAQALLRAGAVALPVLLLFERGAALLGLRREAVIGSLAGRLAGRLRRG